MLGKVWAVFKLWRISEEVQIIRIVRIMRKFQFCFSPLCRIHDSAHIRVTVIPVKFQGNCGITDRTGLCGFKCPMPRHGIRIVDIERIMRPPPIQNGTVGCFKNMRVRLGPIASMLSRKRQIHLAHIWCVPLYVHDLVREFIAEPNGHVPSPAPAGIAFESTGPEYPMGRVPLQDWHEEVEVFRM